MTVEQDVSNEELDEFLREDRDLFLEALVTSRTRLLLRYIKRVSRGILPTEEMMDVLQETFLGVWKQINKSQFDPNDSMKMVYAIARNQAITARKKKLGNTVKSDLSLVASFALADLDGASFNIRWTFSDPLEKKEIETALHAIINELPPRQHIVAQQFVEMYEEIRQREKYKPLADAVGRVTGMREDVASVKSALQAAMRTIRDELSRQGFSHFGGRRK